MKVLIGAIGTSSYDQVVYEFRDGSQVPARYFIVGLAEKINADLVLVLLTEDARILQWEYKDGSGLENEFKKRGITANPIDIPKGLSEEEAWLIFNSIADNLPEEAEVVLDITHGLRSIPFLLLLSINYLKSVKNAKIVDIYYGALEGTDKNNNVKPAYSMGNFVTLLDWSVGVSDFKRTGDLNILASLLEERQTNVRRSSPNSPGLELPEKLKSVARWLRRVSAALDLTRPEEVMKTSHQLINEIKQAEKEFPKWAQPFAFLLNEIVSAFEPLALDDTRNKENTKLSLDKQFKLIEWYRQKEKYLSAIILLREWITSRALYNKGDSNIFDKDKREKVDKEVFNETSEVAGHIKELTDLRNDIAHVGMRPKPEQADALKNRFDKAFKKISEERSRESK
jgi:CRISPR-associated DxTHG motif protein